MKKKEKNYPVICITNFFKKSMLVMSIMLFLLVANLMVSNLIPDVISCMSKFIESFNQTFVVLGGFYA